MKALLLCTNIVCVAFEPSAGAGDCPRWIDGGFTDSAPTNGMGDSLTSARVWDPDGAGGQPPVLLVAGDLLDEPGFQHGVVSFNSVSNGWQSLPGTFSHSINAIGTYGNDVIVAGTFTSIGNTPAKRVARWNGAAWTGVGGGVNLNVNAITEYDGDLIVAGSKVTGAIDQEMVSRWTGLEWQNVGESFVGGNVFALAPHDAKLFAGGLFSGGVRHWNETSGWQDAGSGLGTPVRALQGWNGLLIAGGTFNANGYAGIGAWNGTSWSPLADGIVGEGGGVEGAGVFALAVFNNELVAAGLFHTAGGQPASNIARWNGTSWQPLGAGIDGKVRGLAAYNGQLYAVGDFSMAGGVAANNIARWNGSTWSPILVGNTFSSVQAITTFGSQAVIAGTFSQVTTFGAPANNIVAFNGLTTSTFGSGTNGTINALKSFTYSGPFGDRELIAAGNFTVAGSVGANRIARWVVDPINALPPPQWQPMGAGFNTTVMAIERFNNETYAAGFFINSGGAPVNYIAKWNEVTDTWQPVGTGMNDGVFVLKAYGGYLYAGGLFTTAGGVTTGGFARWNGTSWSQVGGNFLGIVTALEVHNGELVIGGIYPGINNSPNLAKYNGSSYSTLGVGGTNAAVWSLCSLGGNLYVGGEFTMIGGLPADRLGVWNGSTWAEAGGGTAGGANKVFALAPFQNEVQVGGNFASVDGGALASRGWARHLPTGAPWVAVHPTSTVVAQCMDSILLIAQEAAGYWIGGVEYQWRHNGTPLTDGVTSHGSMISGATGPVFSIIDVHSADAGSYDCIIFNGCGGATSNASTVSLTNCCVTDINGDNTVNVSDLLTVISTWGACADPNDCPADVNGDDMVNVADLLAVISTWGPCP